MLEKDIVKLGLSEKEAQVYLASLELGPSTVQSISQKAEVNRATTYVVIDSLMEMGLMSTYDEGKKALFTAESPERLSEYLKNQENSVRKKIDILKDRMPELKSLLNAKGGKPKVKYYEGHEGLRTVQMDFVNSLNNGEVIYTFVPMDDYEKSRLKEKESDIAEKRLAKNIKMKVVYTCKKGRCAEYEKQEEKRCKEYLYIDYDKYPFHGGMNIYANKFLMIDYEGEMGGVVIENKTMTNTLRVLFELIWNSNKKQ